MSSMSYLGVQLSSRWPREPSQTRVGTSPYRRSAMRCATSTPVTRWKWPSSSSTLSPLPRPRLRGCRHRRGACQARLRRHRRSVARRREQAPRPDQPYTDTARQPEPVHKPASQPASSSVATQGRKAERKGCFGEREN